MKDTVLIILSYLIETTTKRLNYINKNDQNGVFRSLVHYWMFSIYTQAL
jgi:hypothetical protein